jgi:hypothetical protein
MASLGGAEWVRDLLGKSQTYRVCNKLLRLGWLRQSDCPGTEGRLRLISRRKNWGVGVERITRERLTLGDADFFLALNSPPSFVATFPHVRSPSYIGKLGSDPWRANPKI